MTNKSLITEEEYFELLNLPLGTHESFAGRIELLESLVNPINNPCPHCGKEIEDV